VAGLISPELLDQIRTASDIVDIIGGYIPLKKAGTNFVALCPFHREKSPSFNVNAQRQIFHCFGCHKGGDVISFVREYENLNFFEAVKRLAERASIPLELDKDPKFQQTRQLKEVLLTIHEQIAQRWHSCLLNDAQAEIARSYLKSRAVEGDAVETFRLGYAPDAWDDTVNWAKAKKFDLPTVETAGLILKRDGRDGYYDRFRGRLVFPICDDQGRVIGFSGRVLDPEAKAAKYVNSPETPLFTKGRVFFGLDKSKRAILDAQQAIVCEGQLDLIRCFVNGVKNVVAPQGTALTGDQARILKRYSEEVVLCFDADVAGRNASERSFENLAETGLAVRVASVPAPHDPDSFIRERGGDAFRELIDKAPGYYDFLLDRLCGENDTASDRGRMAVVKGMAVALAKAGNQVLHDTYTRKTALLVGVSADAIRQEFRKQNRSQRESSRPEPEIEEAVENIVERPDAHELWMLHLLLKDDALIEWFIHHLNPEWVQNSTARELFYSRLSRHDVSAAAFISDLSDDVARGLASEIIADAREIPEPQRQAQDVVTRLRNRFLDAEMNRLKAASAAPELADEELLALSQQLESLRRAKRAPLESLPEF